MVRFNHLCEAKSGLFYAAEQLEETDMAAELLAAQNEYAPRA